MINHPIRGRFNARCFTALGSYLHWKYAAIKSGLIGQAPAVVVEPGPGSGANPRDLAPGTRLIVIEPNQQMHAVLRHRALQYVLQHMIKRSWKWVLWGGDLCRDTASALHSADCAQADGQRLVLPTIFLPIRHQISAVCVN